jgi:ArsR family transcriptional regulator
MATRITQLESLYRTLADGTRLRILALLAGGGGEICVCHLHESLRLPQPTVSRHLAYLRKSGLVDSRRDGLWVHYRLVNPDDPALGGALAAAIHAVGHVTAVHSDQRRLEQQVPGRPRPAGRLLPVLGCCNTPGQ